MATECELAYLAGFIDADGSISIMKNGPESHNHTIRVRVFNTNRQNIDWIVERFGGSVVLGSSASSYGFKTCWAIHWNGNTAAELLKRISPYLVQKLGQGLASIEYDALVSNPIQDGTIRRAREALYNKVHTLNKRNKEKNPSQ